MRRRNGQAGAILAGEVIETAKKLPQARLLIEQVETEVKETGVHLRATVFLQIEVDPAQIATKRSEWDTGFLFLAGFENGPIFRSEQLVYQAYDHSLQLDVMIPDEIPTSTGVLAVCVLSEEYIGCDVEQRVELHQLFGSPAAQSAGVTATAAMASKAQQQRKKRPGAGAKSDSTTPNQGAKPAKRNRTYSQPDVPSLLSQFAEASAANGAAAKPPQQQTSLLQYYEHQTAMATAQPQNMHQQQQNLSQQYQQEDQQVQEWFQQQQQQSRAPSSRQPQQRQPQQQQQ